MRYAYVVPMVLAAALVDPSQAGEADPITGMCLDTDRSATVCQCASARLAEGVSDDALSLYREVAERYRSQLARDVSAGEAWDAGIREAAGQRGQGFVETMKQTNQIGRSHRQAIKACVE